MYFCNHTKELEGNEGHVGAVQLPGLCLVPAALEISPRLGGIQPREEESYETPPWPQHLLQ